MFKHAVLLLCLIGVMLAAGCPGKQPGLAQQANTNVAKPTNAAGAPASTPPSGFPVALSTRSYKDVNDSVKQAWFLIETSYFVVGSQWSEAQKLLKSSDPAKSKQGQDLKAQLTKDIERKIFGTNDKVETLFKQAMEAEPDNPLNMASYAFYLRSRKRFTPNSDSFQNTEKDALDLMDKAIEKWPDEWSFYMMKAFILNEPQFCDQWFRSTAMEEIAISQRLPMIRELCTKAEQYFPDNAFINYYLAMILWKYSDPSKFTTTRDEIMRELRAGNKKNSSYFWFFPPLKPIMDYAIKPTLSAGLKEAQYTDQWQQCGHIDPNLVAPMVIQLAKGMQKDEKSPPEGGLEWPKDKDDLATVMEFVYKVGRVEPMDRSLFSLQSQVLLPVVDRLKPNSADAQKFADLMRFLNAQYQDAAQYLFDRKLVRDRTQLDVTGIALAETRNSREPTVTQECQAREAAFLKRAGEILGLKFNIPSDPSKW